MTTTPQAVLDRYRDALRSKHVDAFLALYTADARVFDTWGVWSYDGTPGRRGSIEGWFSSLGEERVEVTFTDVKVVDGRDLAVVTATGRYAAVSADGTELRAMQNRFTWALQQMDGDAWAIAHEHTSVPIGFGDLKGILQRDAA